MLYFVTFLNIFQNLQINYFRCKYLGSTITITTSEYELVSIYSYCSLYSFNTFLRFNVI